MKIITIVNMRVTVVVARIAVIRVRQAIAFAVAVSLDRGAARYASKLNAFVRWSVDAEVKMTVQVPGVEDDVAVLLHADVISERAAGIGVDHGRNICLDECIARPQTRYIIVAIFGVVLVRTEHLCRIRVKVRLPRSSIEVVVGVEDTAI